MVELPQQIFFLPNLRFNQFALRDDYRMTRWVDCGAGCGALGSVLSNLGIEVECIDLHERPDPYHPVIIGDARLRYWDRSDTVVLARPSHGEWVQQVLRSAARDASHALYIGLERNVEVDIPDMVVERLAENVGEEGECIWRCLGHGDDCEEWSLLKWDYWNEPGWVIDGGPDTWYHDIDKMAHMGKPEDAEVIETRLACRKDLLPCRWEPRIVEGCLDGWVLPDGSWHQCGYHEHDTLVHDRFRIEVGRAEQLGFVRCQTHRGEPIYTKPNGERLAPAQRRTLKQLGFHVWKED